ESEAPETFVYYLLLSESTSLEDEARGGGGSCKDPEALEALGAPEAHREGGRGGGGGDPYKVLGESDLF
nr:hypothetical protein [Tanacetum cinerariifolium]